MLHISVIYGLPSDFTLGKYYNLFILKLRVAHMGSFQFCTLLKEIFIKFLKFILCVIINHIIILVSLFDYVFIDD